MGYGDDIMATGMARGAAARAKRIAFGDGERIIWGPWSEEIFRNNPNIARPGSEHDADIEWVHHYKGHRLYNHQGAGRWVWHMEFRPVPGEIFFSENETAFANSIEPIFVLLEPNVPAHKSVAVNKQWPIDRFQRVTDALRSDGRRVVQLKHAGAQHSLSGVERIETRSFRDALAVLSRASLYLGHEGGLHHGAAAVGVPGVVLFGGFIPPQVTGYDTHINIAAGGEACGSLRPCPHCRNAMRSIAVEQVYQAAQTILSANRSVA